MNAGESELIDYVMAHVDATDPLLVLPRTYLWAWESDVLGVDRRHRVSEYEIKTSRADFLNDFNKHYGSYSKPELLREHRGPNYFWYVTPLPVYRKIYSDLPDYAGLLIARKEGGFEIRIPAPPLHDEKLPEYQLRKLYEFCYQRYRRAEAKNRELRETITQMNRHFAEERRKLEAGEWS